MFVYHVLILALLALAHAGGPSFYPCPGPKAPLGKGVTCGEVKLPPNMCNACKLREPHAVGKLKGQFKDCANIYDTYAPSCMSSLEAYVAANPCDKIRAANLADLKSAKPSWQSRVQMDYFFYSLCEQCCDCIPIGADKSANKGQWVTYRGNCPAHAWYDVCAILPDVTHFVKIGQATPAKFKNSPPKMCPLLTQWAKSSAFANWQKNPKTNFSPKLDAGLESLLDSIECSNPSIWDSCFNLESLQNNLGTPGDFKGTPNPAVDNPPAPPTTNPPPVTPPSTGGNTADTCSGEINWGCLDWCDGSCKQHGCKCFPNRPKNDNVPNSCFSSGLLNQDGTSSYDGNLCGGGGGSTTATSTTPAQNTNPSCNGRTGWGCVDWDAANGVCAKHGCKCFPGQAFQPIPDSCYTSGGLTRP